MNLIWAFNFDQAVDTATGLPVPVDTFDYLRVSLVDILEFLHTNHSIGTIDGS